MCDFSKEDVLKMARAICDDPLECMSGGYTPFFFCNFCASEHSGDEKNFKHDLNCPVLIAQDILTRNI